MEEDNFILDMLNSTMFPNQLSLDNYVSHNWSDTIGAFEYHNTDIMVCKICKLPSISQNGKMFSFENISCNDRQMKEVLK